MVTNIEEIPLRQVEANLIFNFSYTGNLGIEYLTYRLYNDTDKPRTIKSVRASCGIAPTGTNSGVTVNVYKNEVSIFTPNDHPTNPFPGEHPRVYIPAGSYTAVSTPMTGLIWDEGEFLTVSIDSIGSSFSGADLTINVVVSE